MFLFRLTFYFFYHHRILENWLFSYEIKYDFAIFIWDPFLPLKNGFSLCFILKLCFQALYYIYTYWIVLRGNAVYRRIRKWRSVFILAVWGRIMYFPGLSFIVLRTCWKFCSNVSPISSISIPCFCCLAFKIQD